MFRSFVKEKPWKFEPLFKIILTASSVVNISAQPPQTPLLNLFELQTQSAIIRSNKSGKDVVSEEKVRIEKQTKMIKKMI